MHGEQTEDDTGDEIRVEVVFGEKPLDSPQTRICFRRGVESSCQHAKAHSFNLAKSHYKERYELDMGKIDVFSENIDQRARNFLIFVAVIDFHRSMIVVDFLLLNY